MKAIGFLNEMFKSKLFWGIFAILMIFSTVKLVEKNQQIQAAPVPTAVPTPSDPFDRGWQEIQVPSMEYTAERAAKTCLGEFPDSFNGLEKVTLGGQVVFLTQDMISVEVAGVAWELEVSASPSGLIIHNLEDLPEGDIREAYRKAAPHGRDFYYIKVELQDEPDLTSLTTPARVLCVRW
jgi:hypothetical protein